MQIQGIGLAATGPESLEKLLAEAAERRRGRGQGRRPGQRPGAAEPSIGRSRRLRGSLPAAAESQQMQHLAPGGAAAPWGKVLFNLYRHL